MKHTTSFSTFHFSISGRVSEELSFLQCGVVDGNTQLAELGDD